MASLAYEKERRAIEAMLAYGIIMKLPAFRDKPEIIRYLGTRNFECDGYNFNGSLKDSPSINYQSGSGQDKASFSLIDDDGSFYELIREYDPVIEDCAIIIIECYEVEGAFESQIVFPGFIESLTRPDTESLINISAVNDMSRLGYLVGGRVISKVRCAAKFPVGGSPNPEFDPCGWIEELGGNPNFCTHLLEGKDGCIDHGNKPRFYAIRGISQAQVQSVPTSISGIGGSGWDYYTDRMREYPNYEFAYQVY